MSEESDRSRIPYSASGETEHYIKKLAFHLLTNGVILVQLQTLHDHLYMFDRLWKPKSRTAPQMGSQPPTAMLWSPFELPGNAAGKCHAKNMFASDFLGTGPVRGTQEHTPTIWIAPPASTMSCLQLAFYGVTAPQMSSQRLLR